MSVSLPYTPGAIVRARGRDWIVLPESRGEVLHLRTMGGSEDDVTVLHAGLEPQGVQSTSFPLPNPGQAGTWQAAELLRNAYRMKLRAGAGPFRSFGNLSVEPRAYQLVPLMMALRQTTVRLLIADDVGIGKTIEAGLIARELWDRGEIKGLAVLCPPHLCGQWERELRTKFNLDAVVISASSAGPLERALPAGSSLFKEYPITVVSLDYIKSTRRRDEFLHSCPECVLVDEAHTCTRSGNKARQQRFELLKKLSESPVQGQDTLRHMILLTATPHSGDEDAFYNLLTLLHADFANLKETTGKAHETLRERLAMHFVQRRRPDIEEWRDSSSRLFPDRQSMPKDPTYKWTQANLDLFSAVRDHAVEILKASEGKSKFAQRLSYWAALALLRCVASSPAAAIAALSSRSEKAQAEVPSGEANIDSESPEQLQEQEMQDRATDGSGTDTLSSDDLAPALAPDGALAVFARIMAQAEALKGADKDPKLAMLMEVVKKMVKDKSVEGGFRPVIFCRYLATADYLQKELEKEFKKHKVVAITGALPPSEREALVAELEGENAILVATDCLSEGINLQQSFNAVIHYDLSWNPTRHEQREGRVDRFGQPDAIVRTAMIYGENNPIDLVVLDVNHTKARIIEKELGVKVPLSDDEHLVSREVLRHVLSWNNKDPMVEQLSLQLDLGESKAPKLHQQWDSYKERAKRINTIFAQRGLKPEQVMPEWQKCEAALGAHEQVENFLRGATTALDAPLGEASARDKAMRLPWGALPESVRERLQGLGFDKLERIALNTIAPKGATAIFRTHPLVSVLADHVTEVSLSEEAQSLKGMAARSSAQFTKAVSKRTTLLLLRMRCQLTLIRKNEAPRVLLAEEAVQAIWDGEQVRRVQGESDLALFHSQASKNMEPQAMARQIQTSLDRLPEVVQALNTLAQEWSADVLADHRRVRDASDARGTYQVTPLPPPDLIGLYVLLPDLS